MKQNKFWGCIAGLNGFMSVGMGAVSAHAITDASLAMMAEKAAWYQLIHALLLVVLVNKLGVLFSLSRWFIGAGILFFCGTLYLHALTGNIAVVHFAPMGGISLMLGWLLIAYAFYKGDYTNG